MKKTIANKGVASLETLRDLCLEAEVKMIACNMTVELFGFQKSDFIDGIEFAGAATYMEYAGKSTINLFV